VNNFGGTGEKEKNVSTKRENERYFAIKYRYFAFYMGIQFFGLEPIHRGNDAELEHPL
jgi:hypothetical protein